MKASAHSTVFRASRVARCAVQPQMPHQLSAVTVSRVSSAEFCSPTPRRQAAEGLYPSCIHMYIIICHRVMMVPIERHTRTLSESDSVHVTECAFQPERRSAEAGVHDLQAHGGGLVLCSAKLRRHRGQQGCRRSSSTTLRVELAYAGIAHKARATLSAGLSGRRYGRWCRVPNLGAVRSF